LLQQQPRIGRLGSWRSSRLFFAILDGSSKCIVKPILKSLIRDCVRFILKKILGGYATVMTNPALIRDDNGASWWTIIRVAHHPIDPADFSSENRPLIPSFRILLSSWQIVRTSHFSSKASFNSLSIVRGSAEELLVDSTLSSMNTVWNQSPFMKRVQIKLILSPKVEYLRFKSIYEENMVGAFAPFNKFNSVRTRNMLHCQWVRISGSSNGDSAPVL
jgi:hypothetical protein